MGKCCEIPTKNVGETVVSCDILSIQRRLSVTILDILSIVKIWNVRSFSE